MRTAIRKKKQYALWNERCRMEHFISQQVYFITTESGGFGASGLYNKG
jgi:hypothetical protein